MHRTLLLAGLLALTLSASAADPSAKDDVTNAAKKLAAAPNYSWKTTVDMGGGGGAGGRMRPGPTEGRTEKDGLTMLSMTRGDTTTEAFLKGDKAAIKTADGWKSVTEATEGGGGGGQGGGQGNPARFIARTLQGYKTPAVEAQDLAGKVKGTVNVALPSGFRPGNWPMSVDGSSNRLCRKSIPIESTIFSFGSIWKCISTLAPGWSVAVF